jgi:hypothetical protein
LQGDGEAEPDETSKVRRSSKSVWRNGMIRSDGGFWIGVARLGVGRSIWRIGGDFRPLGVGIFERRARGQLHCGEGSRRFGVRSTSRRLDAISRRNFAL